MAATTTSAGSAQSSDVITIAPELMQRAGIVTEVVGATGAESQLRVPGTVQPNAYRKVSVTPLVGGRVSRVLVELGQTVTRGAPLAEVYSPEVAQARAAYLTARPTPTQEKRDSVARSVWSRSDRPASRSSTRVRAEHIRHETEGREAAARLRLFGLDPARVGDADHQAEAAASFIRVTAPQSGVVIERPATVGMTAEPSTSLVTIADLSPVWVIAEVYERDLARVLTGAGATVTTEAYPGLRLNGRVTYLSRRRPTGNADDASARRRAEPRWQAPLRDGMFPSIWATRLRLASQFRNPPCRPSVLTPSSSCRRVSVGTPSRSGA